MTPRSLGTSGMNCAPLAQGGYVFGWTVGRPAAHAIIDAFGDHGLPSPMVSVTSLARLQEAFGALDLRLDERTSMRLDLVSA